MSDYISYCISIGCSVVVGCEVVTGHRRYWQNLFARLWRRPPLNWSHCTMIARCLSSQTAKNLCVAAWSKGISSSVLLYFLLPFVLELMVCPILHPPPTKQLKIIIKIITAYTPLGPIVTVFHGAFCLSLHSVCLHSCVALFSNTLEGPSAQVSSLSCSKNCQNDGTTARAKQRWKTAGKGEGGEINQSTCGQTLHNYIT